MELSAFEKRIAEKAQERFADDVTSAHTLLKNHPILNTLCLKGEDGIKLRLASGSMGYCPSTDLFVPGVDRSLLKACTDFLEVKDMLIKKYIAEETDLILGQLSLLREYLAENNQ